MKYIIASFLLTILFTNSFAQTSSYRPKSIVFLRIDTCVTKGPVSCDSLRVRSRRELIQKATIDLVKEMEHHTKLNYEISDSVIKNFPAIIQEISEDMPLKAADQEIAIESRGDSILRYIKPQQSIGLIYERIEGDGKIYACYRTSDSNFFQNSYNVFESKRDYEILVIKSDRKIILGVECYKVIITEKEITGWDLPERGDRVFEMYVTDTISLPLHALLYIQKQFPGFFPLEIKQYYFKSPEFLTIYRVKQIAM